MAREILRPASAVLLSLALIVTLTGPALAARGDLDPSFGGDGKVTTNFTPGVDYASGVAIQADGKIVAAGAADWEYNTSGKFAVARYRANGALDPTFGRDGRVTTKFTTEEATDVAAKEDYASDVAIQADGKIVAAGAADHRFNRSGKFAVARYRANGTLDATFGRDGRVTANFTPKNDRATGVAIQADGKIVVVGSARQVGSDVPDDTQFALARFNADGTLDSTFGGDGKVTTDFEEGWGEALAMAIQADGKIVAAGYEAYGNTGILVRYNTDGTLDSTFGQDGDGTCMGGEHTGVAIQADGKIVVATHGWPYQFHLGRCNADGTPDTTFGEDGTVTTDFAGRWDLAEAVAIQADGKIVVAGRAENPDSVSKFALARYNADGTLDSAFGGDGKVTTNFTTGYDTALGVAIQADGRIVAAGRAGGQFALARYLGE
jgi:uncharacterized delta-60 repeat protein